MASIIQQANGRKAIQFKAPNGKRPMIRLGKVTATTAAEIRAHVEHLAECWRYGKPPCKQTDRFISELLADQAKHEIYDRLAVAGLVEPRELPATGGAVDRLGAFIDSYIDGRTDIEAGTEYNLRRVRERLVEHFGESKRIAEITPADADTWRLWLQSTVGANTTRRSCGRAKQFFRWAVRSRLLAENPFADMKGLTVQPNKSRDFFVTREIAYRVLDACPDAEWRLLFALARFGGLRCPSETLSLTWDRVNWEHCRMTISSPKTKRYEGKESRIVPIFPELRPYLDEAFDLAQDGAVYAVARYRGGGCNLRTQLERIIRKAGLEPWPKLWQNLRASRATELASYRPAFLAAAYLGHSPAIASKFYHQVTDADILFDAGQAPPEAMQKALQPGNTPDATGSCDAMHGIRGEGGKNGHLLGESVTPTGLEPVLPA